MSDNSDQLSSHPKRYEGGRAEPIRRRRSVQWSRLAHDVGGRKTAAKKILLPLRIEARRRHSSALWLGCSLDENYRSPESPLPPSPDSDCYAAAAAAEEWNGKDIGNFSSMEEI